MTGNYLTVTLPGTLLAGNRWVMAKMERIVGKKIYGGLLSVIDGTVSRERPHCSVLQPK